jgi:hypothetical protein
LVQHLNLVLTNKTLYDSYHTWRNEPFRQEFVDTYGFSSVHDSCRMCQWAYARRYGFGWKQSAQKLVELAIPRDLHVGDDGLVVKPFVERWMNGRKHSQLRVERDADPHVVHVGKYISRTIQERDGIIDILIEGGKVPKRARLPYIELQVPLKNVIYIHERLEGVGIRKGVIHMLQNATSRFSFVTFPEVLTMERVDNTIRFSLTQLPLRIRVITEDVDVYHKGADLVSNYFGRMMVEDFLNPIEAFTIDASVLQNPTQ